TNSFTTRSSTDKKPHKALFFAKGSFRHDAVISSSQSPDEWRENLRHVEPEAYEEGPERRWPSP
ncbi:MAG: hypothetical protein QGI77_01780, partial [Roseibacillus sp.]|nr:hypothetical protein [Roseibacillus sp.]